MAEAPAEQNKEMDPRPALDLTASGNITPERGIYGKVSLKIYNKWLAATALIGGGMGLAAFFYNRPELVKMAVKNALQVAKDLLVAVIRSDSILVELHCYTKESFLSFMEDFEKKKVKQRLEQEFQKVDYKCELEVTIINVKEVYEKLDRIRKLELGTCHVEVESKTPATVAVQETLANLSLTSAAHTSPASSTEQETLPGEVHDQESGIAECRSGYVLMINNYDFPQSQGYLDLYHEFKKFGFRIRRDEELTTHEMLKAVRHTAKRDFSMDDCFVCVILSQGSKDGIYGTDNEAINLDEITTLFRSSDKNPSLCGKPKIFLIEACQRSQTDKGPDSVQLPPVISKDDFLICYASASPHCKRKKRPIYSVAEELKSKSKESGSTVDITMMMKTLQQWKRVKVPTKTVVFKWKMEH